MPSCMCALVRLKSAGQERKILSRNSSFVPVIQSAVLLPVSARISITEHKSALDSLQVNARLRALCSRSLNERETVAFRVLHCASA